MTDRARLTCGVGINDASYRVESWEWLPPVDGKNKRKLLWRCPFYAIWHSLLMRCYDEKFLSKHKSYVDKSVCEDWHLFSNFRDWMIEQDWEGKELDKDILFRGNKEYSPTTCRFVSQHLNTWFQKITPGKVLPMGVYFNNGSPNPKHTYYTSIRPPYGKSFRLGTSNCELECQVMYAKKKLEYTHIIIEGERPLPEIADALIKHGEYLYREALIALDNKQKEVA